MERKIRLDVEALGVESFETHPRGADLRGTVHAHVSAGCQPTPPVYDDDCTCNATCLCRTAAYYCATVMATVVSCHYTENVSCAYDTYTTCQSAGEVCIDTGP